MTQSGSSPVPMDDRGLAYGDGLFETILVRNGEPTLWHYHLSRLQRGCEVLGFSCPPEDSLKAAFSSEYPLQVTKLIVTRGSGGRGYALPDSSLPRIRWKNTPFSPQLSRWALVNTVLLCDLRLSNQPLLAGIKHLNRLENVLARREVSHADYAEGLLADSCGQLIEATAMNVAWCSKGRWYTPPITQCGVAGTLRAALLDDKLINIASLSLDEFDKIDSLCLMNSVQGIWPVKSVMSKDQRPLWECAADARESHIFLQQQAHALLGYPPI